jgi:hypothetical protein
MLEEKLTALLEHFKLFSEKIGENIQKFFAKKGDQNSKVFSHCTAVRQAAS